MSQLASLRVCIWLVVLSWPCTVLATSQLSFSSYELNPYIGEHLIRHGATAEIVDAALKHSALDATITYYAAARAKTLARRGLSHAVFPVVYDDIFSNEFVYSDPLPGMNIGLLRKKSAIAEPISLKGKDIGFVRGSLSHAIISKFSEANIFEKSDNQTLLRMLMSARLDYVLIDQFTAADLMVDQFPEMIGQLEFVDTSLQSISFHVAFSRSAGNAEEMVEQFNLGLKEITKSGLLTEILYRHGLYLFPLSKNKKEIHVATVSNAEMLTMQKMTSHYETANPDVEVKWHVMDESTLRRRLLSDLAIGAGQYDVMTIGAYEASIWGPNHWLTPIKNLPDSYQMDDLLPPIKQSLSYQQQLMALPFYAETSVTYYRTDLFEDAGITMSSRPSYDDILEYAKRIHNPHNGVYGVCLRGKPGWGENMAFITTMVNAYGGQWFNMKWQPQLDSQAWHQAISRYVDLLLNYGPPEPHTKDYNQNLQLFANGQCGIWIDASVAAGTLFDSAQSKVAQWVSIAPAPKAVTTKGSSWLWTWSLAIPASSNMQPEALDFITWATSPNYIELVAETDGWVRVPPGTRRSTYNHPDYLSKAPFAPLVLESIEQIDSINNTLPPSPYTGLQFVTIPEFPAIGTQVGIAMSQVLQGELTIHNALIQSQQFVAEKVRLAGY